MKLALLATVALVGTLVIGGSASALPSVGSAAGAPGETVIVTGGGTFDVQSFSQGDLAVTGVSLSTDRATDVTLNVPQGYSLDLTRPAGTSVGLLSAVLVSARADASAFADSELVVDDPAKYAADGAAQACAPGSHAAVWRASFAVLGGQSLSLPLFLDPGAGGGYVIRFCPQWPPSGGLPDGVSAASLFMYIEGLRAPEVNGSYVWSALITPAAEASFQPLQNKAFELRVLVPIPHVLTLRAKYDSKKKAAVLSGKLTAVGQPEPGVSVSFYSFTGSDRGSDDFGPVKTDAGGRFSLRRYVTKTTSFSAAVGQSEPRQCTSASSAPGGCIEQVSRPESASANVVLRGPNDPKLQRRRADQALARRATLKLSDFSDEWEAYPRYPFDNLCPKAPPNLGDLTATGEASSPDFYTEGPLLAFAHSKSSTFATEAEAAKAFQRIARLTRARCIADDARQDDEVSVLSVGPVSFPRLGSETRAFRVVATYHGQVAYLDLVTLRRKRLVVDFAFVANELPVPNEQELVRAVAARAGS